MHGRPVVRLASVLLLVTACGSTVSGTGRQAATQGGLGGTGSRAAAGDATVAGGLADSAVSGSAARAASGGTVRRGSARTAGAVGAAAVRLAPRHGVTQRTITIGISYLGNTKAVND